jgi:hypothetical protein
MFDLSEAVYLGCALFFGWKPKDVDEMPADFVLKLLNIASKQYLGGEDKWRQMTTQ